MPALLKECSYERPTFCPQLIFTNLDMNVANISPAVGESAGGPQAVVHISGGGRDEAACGEAGGHILVGSDLQPQFPQLQLDPEHCPERPVLLLIPGILLPGGAPEGAAGPALRPCWVSVSGDRTEPPEVWSVRRSLSSFPRPLKVGLGFGLAAGAKWKRAWVRKGTLLARLRCQVDSKGKFGHREDASELER